MERSALRDAIDKVAAEDRDGWSGAARSARLLELLEYRERLDAKVLRSVSEWDVQRAWAEDGACTPVAWLTYRAPVPKSEAVRLLRGARLAREHARTGKLLARSTALRLACDSATGRVVRRGDGEVLDLGRRTRLVSAAQRRALVHRDGGCGFPGCDRPHQWCDAHHIVHWVDAGPTDLGNLVLLCRRHHVLCHEGGWRLTRDADSHIRAIPP